MKQWLITTLVLFGVLAVVPACKWSPGCLVEEKVVTSVSNALSSGLQCSRPELVREDIGNLVGKLKLCKKTETGVICGIVASMAVEQLAKVAIPPRWECSATAAKEKIVQIISAACPF
jgi:hypothetical protein